MYLCICECCLLYPCMYVYSGPSHTCMALKPKAFRKGCASGLIDRCARGLTDACRGRWEMIKNAASHWPSQLWAACVSTPERSLLNVFNMYDFSTPKMFRAATRTQTITVAALVSKCLSKMTSSSGWRCRKWCCCWCIIVFVLSGLTGVPCLLQTPGVHRGWERRHSVLHKGTLKEIYTAVAKIITTLVFLPPKKWF